MLNLLKDLQDEFAISYLFIAHDLSVVKYLSDKIAVMYLGRIVEMGTSEEIFENPSHPYTKALIASIPHADPSRAKTVRVPLEGDVPSPINPPPGCTFHTRCPVVEDRCRTQHPELVQLGGSHSGSCHLLGKQ